MELLSRAALLLTVITLQFTAGHVLGFGADRLMAPTPLSPLVIALGNAVGVALAGLLGARAFGIRAPGGVADGAAAPGRRIAAALAGSLAGMGALMVAAPNGYAALALPLALSIAAFHVAVRRPSGAAAPGD